MHVDVHGECVCCGWMQVAREGMFLHGWLLFMVTKYPLFQLNAFVRKKLTFRLLLCNLHQSIHSMHKRLLCMLCCVCSGEDCRIAVETLAFFFNKAFGWNKGYFITNVVAVEHGRYSLP